MGERSGKTVESVGSTRRGSRARGGLAAASTAVGALLLSACGAVSGEPASEGTSTGSSPASQAPTSAASSPAGDAPARVTPLASPSTTNVPSMPNAIPIRSIVTAEFGGDRIAIIKTPSGNIGCDFYTDGSSLGCGVQSLIGTTRRDASGESMWWVDFSGARPQVRSKTDAPYFGYPNPAAQIAQYGTTVTTGNVACRSEKTALTCWNLKTGAGAVMNREQGIRPFTTPPAAVVAPAAGPKAQVVAGPGPGDATYDVVLNGLVPAAVLPEASPRQVRMTRGRAEGFGAENPRAAVWVKGIDDVGGRAHLRHRPVQRGRPPGGQHDVPAQQGRRRQARLATNREEPLLIEAPARPGARWDGGVAPLLHHSAGSKSTSLTYPQVAGLT